MPATTRSRDDRAGTSRWWDHAAYTAAAFAVLLVYAIAVREMPKGVFLVPDDGGKYLMLHSLGWTRAGLSYRLPYGGERIDGAARFYPVKDAPFPYPRKRSGEQMDFHWPIWFPLLSRPFYSLFGVNGIYVLPVLSGWLIAVAGGWVAGRLRRGLAPLATVAVGLSTPVFFYSVTFWEHTTATLLGMLAVLACVEGRKGSRYVVATACLLAAALLRIEMVLLAPPLLVGCLVTARRMRLADFGPRSDRRTPWPALLLLTVLLLLMTSVCYVAYPHLPSRLQTFIVRLPHRLARLSSNLANLPDGMAAILVNSDASGGPRFAWPRSATVTVALALMAPFLRPTWLRTVCLFGGVGVICGLTAWLVLTNEPYLSMHGFFPIAPFCLLAPYALVSAWRQGHIATLRLAVIGLAYLVLGIGAVLVILIGPDGQLKSGIEWGQRYLLTLYPLLTLLSLIGMADYWRGEASRRLRSATILLAMVTVLLGNAFQLRALATADQELRIYASWDKALRRGQPVVTDASWLPATLADLFVTHEMFVLESAQQLDDWVKLARAHGVRRFLFASADDAKRRDFGVSSAYRTGEAQQLPRLLVTPFEIPAE